MSRPPIDVPPEPDRTDQPAAGPAPAAALDPDPLERPVSPELAAAAPTWDLEPPQVFVRRQRR